MRYLSWISFSIALTILGINVSGFFIPLRASEIDGYVDFTGVATKPADETLARLDALPRDLPSDHLVAETTLIFYEGIAHVDKQDIQQKGFDHFGMTLPITENWVLFLLRYLKPDTYIDYEFCSYRRAVRRGTGRCGQQSLAVVSFLNERGLETGFVYLEGHTLAKAQISPDRWYMLDPDYGAVLPFGIEVAEKRVESLLEYYWSPAAAAQKLHLAFLPDNRVKYGGPSVRYPRACLVEQLAYFAKWFLPLILLSLSIFWGSRALAKAQSVSSS